MNLIETIIAIFLLLVVVINFVMEPKLSYDYFKATLKSARILVVKIKNFMRSSLKTILKKTQVTEI